MSVLRTWWYPSETDKTRSCLVENPVENRMLQLTFHTLFYAIFMNFYTFHGEMKVLWSTLSALRYSS